MIIDRLEDGTVTTRLFSEEQNSSSMLNILGYNQPVSIQQEEDLKAKSALEIKSKTKLASV